MIDRLFLRDISRQTELQAASDVVGSSGSAYTTSAAERSSSKHCTSSLPGQPLQFYAGRLPTRCQLLVVFGNRCGINFLSREPQAECHCTKFSSVS